MGVLTALSDPEPIANSPFMTVLAMEEVEAN
jgi:hypothetical protein